MMSEPSTPTLLTPEQITAVIESMDPEALAFSTVVDALELIDAEARARVLGHAYSRFVSAPEAEGLDERKPRTFWLDEMPATGDLFSVDGRDLPVTDVTIGYEDTGLTWSMVAAQAVERSDGEGSAA